jgi:hypothetical protein
MSTTQGLSNPAPGLYPGVSYDEYSRWPAVNWSVLSKFKRSAAHARQEITAPPDGSDAMALGSATHCAVLEPEKFQRDYVVVPEDAPQKRSRVDKIWWAEYERANSDRTIITQKEHDLVVKMQQAVYTNPLATELLTARGALKEVGVRWDDPDTGIACKARVDLVSRCAKFGSVVVDFKTIIDAARWAFSGFIAKYTWADQLQWYCDGLSVVSPYTRTPMFIVVEKEPPYCAVVYDLELTSQEQARLDWTTCLKRYQEAIEKNLWPGYPDGSIGLPLYAFTEGD